MHGLLDLPVTGQHLRNPEGDVVHRQARLAPDASQQPRAQRRLQGFASTHYRIAIGPNAGKKALTLRTVPARPEPFASTLLARQPGFSLHAATRCEANQRDKLEKLCRTITRPAIANQRLSMNEREPVIDRFKQPFRDGTTQVVLDPLEPPEALL